jgi:hypothetical protein
MIKPILLSLLLSISILAATAPMTEQEARPLFQQIKKSEYRWVLAQWRKEMKIKTRSRSSSRRAGTDKTPYNDPLRTIVDPQVPNYPPVDPITLPNQDY